MFEEKFEGEKDKFYEEERQLEMKDRAPYKSIIRDSSSPLYKVITLSPEGHFKNVVHEKH